MYIGSLAVIALLVIVMVMFVKTCSIMNCASGSEKDTGRRGDAETGDEK